jgi:hypothetical protein
MLLHQPRGELALHHNRIVTLLIKAGSMVCTARFSDSDPDG